MVSKLLIGGSGSGKSEYLLQELMKIARAGSHAIVLEDPHGLTAQKFMLNLVDEGLDDRVLYDQLSNFERVLGGITLMASEDKNPFRRKSQNTRSVMALMHMLWRASQRPDAFTDHPMIYNQTILGARLMMFQPEPQPLKLLPIAFEPKHPLFYEWTKNCTDLQAKANARYLRRLATNNSDNLLESKLGGSQRLSQTVFDFPTFAERCESQFVMLEALRQKKIIIRDGSDDGSVAEEARTAVFGSTNLQVIQALRANFARTNSPLPTVVCWEEAPAANLIGPAEINMLREGRKYGFSGIVVGQDLGFLDLQTKQTVKSCTPEHVWFNPGDSDLAMEAAQDIALAKLNPNLVKYEHISEKMVHDGYVTKKRKGTSRTDDRHTDTESEYEQAVFRKVSEVKKEFTPLSEQVMLEAQALLQMGPGWYESRNRRSVTQQPVYSPMLPEPWPEAKYPWPVKQYPSTPERPFHFLWQVKLFKAIQKSQQQPEFTTPVDSEPTWNLDETTTPTQKNGTNGRTTFSKPTQQARNN